jgi:hypothetical protein
MAGQSTCEFNVVTGDHPNLLKIDPSLDVGLVTSRNSTLNSPHDMHPNPNKLDLAMPPVRVTVVLTDHPGGLCTATDAVKIPQEFNVVTGDHPNLIKAVKARPESRPGGVVFRKAGSDSDSRERAE